VAVVEGDAEEAVAEGLDDLPFHLDLVFLRTLRCYRSAPFDRNCPGKVANAAPERR
jgi:hypothetical protein